MKTVKATVVYEEEGKTKTASVQAETVDGIFIEVNRWEINEKHNNRRIEVLAIRF